MVLHILSISQCCDLSGKRDYVFGQNLEREAYKYSVSHNNLLAVASKFSSPGLGLFATANTGLRLHSEIKKLQRLGVF